MKNTREGEEGREEKGGEKKTGEGEERREEGRICGQMTVTYIERKLRCGGEDRV